MGTAVPPASVATTSFLESGMNGSTSLQPSSADNSSDDSSNSTSTMAATTRSPASMPPLRPDERRLEAVVPSTKLACRIRAGAVGDRVDTVTSALGAAAFSNRIITRTVVLLESGGDALGGGLSLTSAVAWSVDESLSGAGSNKRSLPLWQILLTCVLAVLLGGVCIVVGRIRRKSPSRSEERTAEQQV